jgi:hypothetical protein
MVIAAFEKLPSYLLLHSEHSQINTHTSDWQPVKHGIPQGSILGPLFFLLYINDLPKTISAISNPILFVDDTSMIITNSDPQIFFKKDINNMVLLISTRFKSNLLSLNLHKAHFLQFLTKNSLPTTINKLLKYTILNS